MLWSPISTREDRTYEEAFFGRADHVGAEGGGVSEQTFYRWKKVYGGLEPGQARRLKQLQEENAKLKRLVADLSLDKIMLRDVLNTVLVFDEMTTAFRWHLRGAQHLYGVIPDLSAFGKAPANGFSVSALAGRRDIMKLGGSDHDRERVFLLSTTHGAETHELAASIATMRFYETNPVIERLYARGERLRRGFERVVSETA